MLVEVIVAEVPYVGRLGTRREIAEPQARALIALKKVRAVDGAPARGRRVYQRRDLQAESIPTEAPAPQITQPSKKKARKPKDPEASGGERQ